MTMSRLNPVSLPLLLVLTSVFCGYLPESERETLNSLLRVMLQSVNPIEGPPNPSVHIALRLASDHHLPTEVLLLQQLKMTAVEKVKHGENFSSGLVALYTLAMAASCHNPTDVSYKGERINLVEILQEKLTKEIEHIGKTTFPLSNYYQVSLDVLTLCVMDAEFSQDFVQILIDAVMNDKFTYDSEFSVDTGAVAALALRCVNDRITNMHISNALNYILEQILRRIMDDGLIGNLYSTGLAMQVIPTNTNTDTH
ncbi:transcobalamin-1-like isoform X2 [Chiloscyllium plagiosum]|uniref:transcobalamin-1-like isoform X2 n=1 Tax=Chiloscyllium plagiosum TaxID=36176 RepID=UPI001CB8430A|nr:transcobalamin-1-like isoform X2 [Chiloscyllium plagiosum]